MLQLLYLSLFFMNTNIDTQPEYRVMSLKELSQIMDRNRLNIDTSYIIDYNKAFVTIFKDGTSILTPPALGGDEGLFFANIDVMQRMIQSKIYPVKGNGSFWELEKDRVINFSGSMDYYRKKLSEWLEFKVEFNTDNAYLIELSGIVSKKLQHKTKVNKLLINYVSIYVAEMLRQKLNGKWELLPEYSLNMYYTPEIVSKNTFCNPWYFINYELSFASHRAINIEDIIIKVNSFLPIENRTYKSTK